jgi:hypothetical protein
MTAAARQLVIAVLCLFPLACGQKGPPLAPLHLVPAPVSSLTARRVDDRVRLRFALPTQNANGPGRLTLERVEIYAVTAAPGMTPPNRALLTKTYLVGTIEVRPAPVEGEAPADDDKRPGGGDMVTFDEALTPAKLAPVTVKEWMAVPTPATATAAPGATVPGTAGAPTAGATPAAPTGAATAPTAPATPVAPPDTTAPAGQPAATTAAGEKPVTPPAAGAAPAATQTAAAAPAAKDPARIYIVRGIARGGRPGPPSTRVQIPLVPVPSPPTDITEKVTEAAIVLGWKAPADSVTLLAFNVYRGDDLQPLNTEPLTTPAYEHPTTLSDQEECFRIRSVATVGAARIEGPASEARCVVPRDTFAPAAPKGLAAVATVGQINLIWEANTEQDLAGYVVLRGEAGPSPVLAAITPSPITESSFTDATVTPGVRYVYAIVAVDKATPPNTSPQSERREETAR